MEIILGIIIIVVVIIIAKYPEWKSYNRTSPPGKRTDWNAMNYDHSVNHMTDREIAIKFNTGEYDVPDKHMEGSTKK